MNEPVFIICVNQPGFLPESDPFAVQGISCARDALVEELKATANAHEVDQSVLETAVAWARDADANGASIELSGYVHEIIPKPGVSRGTSEGCPRCGKPGISRGRTREGTAWNCESCGLPFQVIDTDGETNAHAD